MQEGNPLHPFGLAGLRAGRLVPAALRRGAMITTTPASPARAFRSRHTVIVAGGVHARCRPAGPMLRRRGRSLAP
jgi:hypothetical protein